MEDFVMPTGRSRYTTRVIREGRLWWRTEYVAIILQIEEFFQYVTRGEIDRSGHADPDRMHQGYQWRDATLEDLAMMGERKHEPTVETYRRHSRPNGPGPSQPMGPSASFASGQPADDWLPRFTRSYPDVPPAGFEAYTPPDVDPRTQPGAQSPPASGPSY